MEIKEPFHLNNIAYTRESLTAFAAKSLSSGSLSEWERDFFDFILLFFDEKKTLLQKTSGTTGDPKTFELARTSMINSAKMTIDFFKLNPGSSALLCLPIHYIAGKMMLVRALVGGLNLITIAPSGNPLKDVSSPVKFAAMVPLQVHESMKHPAALSMIKNLLIGGGEIDRHLREKAASFESVNFFESFAMTETYTHFAIRKITSVNPDARFKILRGAQISSDPRGCLQVDIPGVTKGIVRTNDLVEINSNNEFEWLGRIDNVIKSGGIKIIPEILEAKIRTIIQHELLVVGVHDEKLGQRLVLVVQIDPDKAPVESWRESMVQLFPKHEVPKEIICLDEFPRNRSMKVDRTKVKAALKAQRLK